MVRRTKTHLWREDPIAWFGLAQRFSRGSDERVLTSCRQEGKEERRLCNRLGDDDGRRFCDERLNSGATTLLVAALFAFASEVVLHRAIIVMVRCRRLLVNFGIVVRMFGVLGLTMFMRSDSVVVVSGLRVARAVAETLHVAQRGAHNPDEHAQRGAGADDRADFRLP